MTKSVYIIGAGPAGLAVAYYLLKNTEYKPIILEESCYIGGISRTHQYNGNCMDLGGHRFFTKDDEVMKFWTDIFPVQEMPSKDDILLDRTEKFSKEGLDPEKEDNLFLKRNRLSRIYFLKKFFDYPISFKLETFLNMGFANLTSAGFGYLYSCIVKRKENSLEDFYINRFGKPLYRMFFEDYTEKLWGIHPSQIEPDWGAQRVKGLSLLGVVKNCLLKPFVKSNKQVETSLIEEFLYPKKGPGQLYEAVADRIRVLGGQVILNEKVVKLDFEDGKISKIYTQTQTGDVKSYCCDVVFSSMPVKDLVGAFNVEGYEEVKNIAKELHH